MKKLILHIGQSKTGTSSLQSFLFAHKNALAQRGILYPDFFFDDTPLQVVEHNVFVDSLVDLSRFPHLSADEYFAQFHEQMEAQNCDTLILSAESFWGVPQVWRLREGEEFFDVYARKLKKLREFTQGFETQIVGYFRSPEEWLGRCIPHIIRYEGMMGVKIYEDDAQIFDLLKPHMDYPRLLSLWQDILQPEAMVVRPFARDALVNHSTIDDFLSCIGLDVAQFSGSTEAHEVHAGLDRRYIEVKKILNQRGHNKQEERMALECLNILNGRLGRIETYGVSDGLRETIVTYCEGHHAWMQAQFGAAGRPFFKVSAARNALAALTQDEVDLAMAEYKAVRGSWPMKIYWLKVFVKTQLRERFPRFYVWLKSCCAKSV